MLAVIEDQPDRRRPDQVGPLVDSVASANHRERLRNMVTKPSGGKRPGASHFAVNGMDFAAIEQVQ